MPEGHTIHRLARRHGRELAGTTLRVSSPQGRFAEGAAALDGRRIDAVEANGKHLFYRFGDESLHVHLGLFGHWRHHRGEPPEPRGQVRLRLQGGTHAADLSGPTACEILSAEQAAAIAARLGPDPLRDDADPEAAWRRIGRSRASIGGLLMNQAVIAGIGNVYRAEILWLVGLHPETAGRDVTRRQWDAIWNRCVSLLTAGVRSGRIVTVEHPEGGATKARCASRVNVYKRDDCLRCGTPVQKWTLAARNAFACPACQPPPDHWTPPAVAGPAERAMT